MAISHRLQSSMYERPDEGIDEKPKRIVFLSVEGDKTERDYFDLINKHRELLGIKSIVHIETLSRKDTRSDPQSVLNLLNDLYTIRKDGLIPKEICDYLQKEGYSISLDQLNLYLDNKLSAKDKQGVDTIFRLVGIDISYQKYLSDYKGSDTDDVFAVVIDRDRHCHTEAGMKQLIQSCQTKGYNCFITNPCFELWLLLHICNVKEIYCDKLNEILKNKRVSKKHTYVSKELSNLAGHSKRISDEVFTNFYLSNVDLAIERAKDFETDLSGLLYSIGTNIPDLFDIFRA